MKTRTSGALTEADLARVLKTADLVARIYRLDRDEVRQFAVLHVLEKPVVLTYTDWKLKSELKAYAKYEYITKVNMQYERESMYVNGLPSPTMVSNRARAEQNGGNCMRIAQAAAAAKRAQARRDLALRMEHRRIA